ncbi:unnamed protein product, partial [Ectocarpus fasciculatus]
RDGFFVTYPAGSPPSSHGAMDTFASSSPSLCAPWADHGGFFPADGFPGPEEAGGSGAGVSGGFGGGGGQNWASAVRGSECQQQQQPEHHMPGFSEGVWYRQQQGPQTLPQEDFGQVDDWLNSPYLLGEDEVGGGHDPDGAVESAARNAATDVENLGIL